MRHHRLIQIIVVTFSLVTIQSFSGPAAAAEKKFTAYNIWKLRVQANMLCLNYKHGDNFIPAGTEVTDIRVQIINYDPLNPDPDQDDTLSFIQFTELPSKRKVKIYFTPNYHPGKSIYDYRDMMFTDKNFTEQTQGLLPGEIEAIKQGIVVDGMSKKAVLMSYGYPPEHKTGSLEQNRWVYWKNKRTKLSFSFNAGGRVNIGITGPIKINVPQEATQPTALPASKDDIIQRLDVLRQLKNQGIITQDEYDAKRKALIDRL